VKIGGVKIRKNGDLRGLPSVRVVGSSGEMLGVMPLAEALRLALKEGLDLRSSPGCGASLNYLGCSGG
jgi:translation initiation factor IF-3